MDSVSTNELASRNVEVVGTQDQTDPASFASLDCWPSKSLSVGFSASSCGSYPQIPGTLIDLGEAGLRVEPTKRVNRWRKGSSAVYIEHETGPTRSYDLFAAVRDAAVQEAVHRRNSRIVRTVATATQLP